MGESREIIISLSPADTWKVVEQAIENGIVSCEVIDRHYRTNGTIEVIVLVLEKYYFRSSNRGSLTLTIDNLEGATKVHAAASGTSQGVIFRIDWGAGDNFVSKIMNLLLDYKVE
jgi:hypothetical protein